MLHQSQLGTNEIQFTSQAMGSLQTRMSRSTQVMPPSRPPHHTYYFSTTGQKFAPSNVHNLGQYDDQWISDIYDMRSWYDGYCHTFDPRETQRRSLGSKLSFYLGHRELLNNDKDAMFKQFTVVDIFFFKLLRVRYLDS